MFFNERGYLRIRRDHCVPGWDRYGEEETITTHVEVKVDEKALEELRAKQKKWLRHVQLNSAASKRARTRKERNRKKKVNKR